MPDTTSTDAGDVRSGEATSKWSTLPTVLTAALIAVCVAVGIAAAMPSRTAIAGLPEPGTITALGLPAMRVLHDLFAAITIGWLLAAALLVPPQRSGVLDVGGYRAVRAAGKAAAVWAAAAFALIPLNVSMATGHPLSTVLGADTIVNGLQLLADIRAPLYVLVAGALIAVLARIVLRPGGAALLLAGAVLALLPTAVTGHAAQSTDHDLASDTMIIHLLGACVWVGGLVAFLGLARQLGTVQVIARRYSALALAGFIAVALSGLGNAWVRFATVQDLWLTEYGQLVLLKAALLGVLFLFGLMHRNRTLPLLAATGSRGVLLRLAVVEILVMAATFGVAVGLSRTASPPPSGAAPSDIGLVLGYDLPGAPTFLRLLTAWRVDLVFAAVSIAAIVGYLMLLRKLKHRGISWPRGRTIAWIAGWLLVLIGTSSGIARYGEAQFSLHMLGHMVLGMLAPILLVLGGPMTLALRALKPAGKNDQPGFRELIVTALHSKLARILTHPITVLALFIGSFFVLYFTSLFETMADSHLGHLLMNAHFLAVGYLYYWVIIGVDPSPRRLQPLLKLALLLGALPFHAFFGLALMNSHQAMATDYYSRIGLPWVRNLVADQQLGGAIAWGMTEVPIIIVVIALLAQWSRSDEREARRSDRLGNNKADEELDAYNAMLAELAFRDLPIANRRTATGPTQQRADDDS